MKNLSIASDEFLAGTLKPSRLTALARRAVHRRLEGIEDGCLILSEGRNEYRFGDRNATLCATISVTDLRFYDEVAFGGTIGGGEAYFRSYWQTDSLTNVVRVLARNRAALEKMESGSALLTRPLQRAFHWLNRNTQQGSRRNISAHYDLGNEFFELWLDERMQYSSAIFGTPETSLKDAQEAKLERLCRKLSLSSEDHLLEIGTGWGGLAVYAAEQYGCRVTTTTISQEQHDYAAAQIRQAGLEDRITLLKQDYRELQGLFDKIVSVEMFEAVGHRFHGTFFQKCRDLLKPDGLMALQTITIADQRYEKAKNSVDFIQRYIFPGGCLPSLTSMTQSLTENTDLRLTHVEDIGPHYATTLRRWHERFTASVENIAKQGYSQEFIRLWEYYLCYCEGGFLERVIGNVQVVARRPLNRDKPFLA